jgi:hypothetical protein
MRKPVTAAIDSLAGSDEDELITEEVLMASLRQLLTRTSYAVQCDFTDTHHASQAFADTIAGADSPCMVRVCAFELHCYPHVCIGGSSDLPFTGFGSLERRSASLTRASKSIETRRRS